MQWSDDQMAENVKNGRVGVTQDLDMAESMPCQEKTWNTGKRTITLKSQEEDSQPMEKFARPANYLSGKWHGGLVDQVKIEKWGGHMDHKRWCRRKLDFHVMHLNIEGAPLTKISWEA